MYGEAYWCAQCLTEIGTWRPDYDSHRTQCDWLTKPYKKDPSLGGHAGMQRLYDYWEGRAALGIPYVWVVEREERRTTEDLLDMLEVGRSPAQVRLPEEPINPPVGGRGADRERPSLPR